MILDEILFYRKEQLQREKSACSYEGMRARAKEALRARRPLSLEKALRQKGVAFICEVKKASPSKGLIAPDFHPAQQAALYEKAGASAISCLTEERFFMGSGAYLTAVREAVKIPVLRKDFLFDPYQVYEAAALGADAVLLIAAVLETETLERLYALSYELGLEVLLEVHSAEELSRVRSLNPRILGVNNRDLKTFQVDLGTVANLRPFAPKDTVFVSESGIQTPADVAFVKAAGADAILIGETLMRAGDVAKTLAELRGAVEAL